METKLKSRCNLNSKLISIGSLQTMETAVVTVAKVFAFVPKVTIQAGKDKNYELRGASRRFYQRRKQRVV